MIANKSNRVVLGVVSVLVALLLFFNVHGQVSQNAAHDVTVDLSYINVPEGFVIENPHDKVTLHFEGPAKKLDALIKDPSTLHPTADLKNAVAGRNVVKVNSNLTETQDVKVTVQNKLVFLDEVGRKEMRVSLETNGLPSDNQLLAGKSVSPKKVAISGASRLIGTVQRVIARLNLSDIRENQQQVTARVECLDQDKQPVIGVTAEPAEVAILVSLAPKPQTKFIVVQPRINGTVAPGYEISRVEVEPNQIEIGGDSDILSQTSVLYCSEVDVNDLKESKSFDAILEIPKRLKTSGRQSVRVRVVINKQNAPTTSSVPIGQ